MSASRPSTVLRDPRETMRAARTATSLARPYFASARWRRNVSIFTFLLFSAFALSLSHAFPPSSLAGTTILFLGITAASLLWGGLAATLVERLTAQTAWSGPVASELAEKPARPRQELLSVPEQFRRSFRREWRKVGVRAAVSATAITLGSALLMFLLERSSNELYGTPWDSLWWSLVTMTTTGYGDIVPKSFGGRTLGVFTMVAGMGLLSVLTALIASAFVTESLKEARGLEAIKGKGHIIVAGWNWGAEQVIKGLAASYGSGALRIVLINQLPEEAVNELLYKFRDLEIRFVRGDFTQEAVLERANVRGAAAAIILADAASATSARADERTILACLALKHLNPDLNVTGELLDAQNAAHFRRANADDVVISGEFNGFLLAGSAASPGIPQAVRALLTYDPRTQLRKSAIPSRFVGRTFGELASYLRQEEEMLAIGIVTEATGLTLADILSADYTSVDEFIQRKFDEAGVQFGGLTQTRVQVNPSDNYVIGLKDSVIVIGQET